MSSPVCVFKIFNVFVLMSSVWSSADRGYNYNELQESLVWYENAIGKLEQTFDSTGEGCDFLMAMYFSLDTMITCTAEKGMTVATKTDACNSKSRDELLDSCKAGSNAKSIREQVHCEQKRIKKLQVKTDDFDEKSATLYLNVSQSCWPGVEV